MEEFRIWKEFPAYEVSSEGYLRRRLPGRGTYVGRIIRGAIRADGYLGVFRFKPFNMMHQVVAHVFHGPCPPGMEPNHKNKIRTDCSKDNLEYVTRSQNVAHSFATCTEEEYRRRRVNVGKFVRTPEIRARTRESALRRSRL